MFSFSFHRQNSHSGSDCIIEGCIKVTDIPSPKRCKLELEENLHRKLIPGDGHCIANCFTLHIEDNLDKVSDKLYTEFPLNLQKYRQKNYGRVYSNITMKQYNNVTCSYMRLRIFIRLE